MPFVFDLESPFFPRVVTDLTFNDQRFLEFRLGFIPELQKRILMCVSFIDIAQGKDDPDICDLRFGIREQHVDHDWNVTGMDFEREPVLLYVPKEKRQEVLYLISFCIERLVEHRLPDIITMSNFYKNLPAAALCKYKLIKDDLLRLGYDVTAEWRDTDGVDRWVFSCVE